MTTMTDYSLVDAVDWPQAAHVNNLRASSLRTEYVNTETISATKELTDADTPFQVITCSGANRTVELPPEATTNHPFLIYNTTPSSDGYTVAVKDDSGVTTYATLTADTYGYFVQVNGEGWKELPTSTPTRLTVGGTNDLINNLTADTAPDRTADYVRTYDASGASEKKVLLGKASPYVIRLETFQSTNDPADATTYYFGPTSNQGWTTSLADYQRLYIPISGTITKAEILFMAVAYGSTETSTVSLRLNNTTDTTLSSAVVNNALYRTQATGLSIAVTAGDYVTGKWVTPNWATNPTDVGIIIQLVIE